MRKHWTGRTHQIDTLGTERVRDRLPTSLIKFLFETADRHAVQFHHGRCTRRAGVQEQHRRAKNFPFPRIGSRPAGGAPTNGHPAGFGG